MFAFERYRHSVDGLETEPDRKPNRRVAILRSGARLRFQLKSAQIISKKVKEISSWQEKIRRYSASTHRSRALRLAWTNCGPRDSGTLTFRFCFPRVQARGI